MRSCLPITGLNDCLLRLYQDSFLSLLVHVLSLPSPLPESEDQVLPGWNSWAIWSWVLYMVRDKGLASFLYMYLSKNVQHIFWKMLFFSDVCLGLVCQSSGSCSCIKLYLSPVFWSIDLCVCFYASTVLCLLLRSWSISWNQKQWLPKQYF